MPNVTQYHVLFYGTADGYQNNRAQIALYEGANTVGYVKFHDPNMPFPNDSHAGGVITMHLPTTMFGPVMDMLRNEKPINLYFSANHAFLGTNETEPVGEAES